MATKPRQRKKANVAKQKRGNVRTGKLADRSLLVHIRLRFLEPGQHKSPGTAKQWRAFPEGMECYVRWGKPVAPVRKGPSVDNSWEASDKDSLARQKCRIARDGQLQFQMSTGDAVKAEWFTVEFEQTETQFFVAEKQGSPRQLAQAATVILLVRGMDCPACALRVRNALLQIEGVVAADVALDHGLAKIWYDAQRVQPELLAVRLPTLADDANHHYTAQLVVVSGEVTGVDKDRHYAG